MKKEKLLFVVVNVAVSNTESIKKKFASVTIILFHTDLDLVAVLIMQIEKNFFKKGMVIIMTDFTLDIANWRCGAEARDYKNKLGKGSTQLTNDFGYSCCIGQFSKQLGIESLQLFNRSTPQALKECTIGIDLPEQFNSMFIHETNEFENSNFANELMEINDESSSTIKSKIKQIKEKLERKGHTLTIINEHLIP